MRILLSSTVKHNSHIKLKQHHQPAFKQQKTTAKNRLQQTLRHCWNYFEKTRNNIHEYNVS